LDLCAGLFCAICAGSKNAQSIGSTSVHIEDSDGG
jgi:hypothetical protein